MKTETETIATAIVATVPTVSLGFDLTVTMATIVTVVLAILAWSHTRWKAINGRIDAQTERLDRHEGRLQSIETALNHLPAKADMHNLQLGMSEMQGDTREIRTAFAALEARSTRQEVVLQRLEDFLLHKDSRR